MSPARVLALKRLDAIELPGWPANACRVRDAGRVEPRDADLAERIVLGVERELLGIRYAIEQVSGRRLSQIDAGVQKILAIAFEQLRSLDRVPAYAVVNDAVEMTRRFASKSASGFVNAILRKAVPLRGRVPLEDGTPSRLRAEREFSLPAKVFDRFSRLYGEGDALALAAGFVRQPPLLARLIGDATPDALRAGGLEATPHEDARIVVLPPTRRDALAAVAHLIQPQDATSAAAVGHLDVRPGMRVLDRCCGRGTKTRQLLEAVGASGHVVAIDTSEERLASLRAAAAGAISAGRLRVARAATVREAGLEGERFDRVLIDAPCSNSGVFARRPGAKYRQVAELERSVLALQRQILNDTADVVAPGGSLQYTTCSVWPEENEAQARAFAAARPEFEIVAEHATRPSPDADPARWRDGGYSCVLRRR